MYGESSIFFILKKKKKKSWLTGLALEERMTMPLGMAPLFVIVFKECISLHIQSSPLLLLLSSVVLDDNLNLLFVVLFTT